MAPLRCADVLLLEFSALGSDPVGGTVVPLSIFPCTAPIGQMSLCRLFGVWGIPHPEAGMRPGPSSCSRLEPSRLRSGLCWERGAGEERFKKGYSARFRQEGFGHSYHVLSLLSVKRGATVMGIEALVTKGPKLSQSGGCSPQNHHTTAERGCAQVHPASQHSLQSRDASPTLFPRDLVRLSDLVACLVRPPH